MSNDLNRQSPSDADHPLVSIGLPVYNGENYIAYAIESVLAQTLRDFELIICDNASTDRTQAICEEYARRDVRVRYVRNARNLGAGPNYDLTFHRSRGTFFNWLAHDDGFAPTYLEEAVACLQRNPSAVLCYAGITEIGANGEVLRVYKNALPGLESACASTRLAGIILNRHQCEPFFGLFRRDALVGSELHGLYSGSDRVLLAEMALRGACIGIDPPLFIHREHIERYTRAILLRDRENAARWQNSDLTTWRRSAALFHLVVYENYWRIVRKNIGKHRERWACYGQLVRWWFEDGHFRDVVRDVLAVISPRLLAIVRHTKRALFGIGSLPPGSLPPLLGDSEHSSQEPFSSKRVSASVGKATDGPAI